MLRPVDSAILFFRGNLYPDSRMYAESYGIHLLTIVRPLLGGGLICFLLKTHKNHLRKIQIEKCVVLEAKT